MVAKGIRLGLFVLILNMMVLLFSVFQTYLQEWGWPSLLILTGYFVILMTFAGPVTIIAKGLKLEAFSTGLMTFAGCLAIFFGSDFPGASWLYLIDPAPQTVNLELDANHTGKEFYPRIFRLQHVKWLYEDIGQTRVKSSVKSGESYSEHSIYVLPAVPENWRADKPVTIFIQLEKPNQKVNKMHYFVKGRQTANIRQAIDDAVKRFNLNTGNHILVLEPTNSTSAKEIIHQVHLKTLILILLLNFIIGVVIISMRKRLWPGAD